MTTGPGSSPSTVPDLAALREWVDLYLDPVRAPARPTALSWPVTELAAVLSLVDGLRAENERLREYVEANEELERELGLDEGAYLRYRAARAALAGSPAANEEQQCPACRGSGFHKRMLGRQIVHTPCDKCTGTGKA